MSSPGIVGFVRKRHNGSFYVDWRGVAAESYLATSRLLVELVKHRELAHGVMLDIGCGTKPYRELFAPYVSSHIGVDMSFSLHNKAHIDVYGSATSLPFSAGSFDFVLCTEVLEHVPEPDVTLREIARVLRRGGTAIVTTPFMYRVHEAPYDFFRYTPFSYRMLASKAGLEVIKLSPRGGLLTVWYDLHYKLAAVVVGALNRIYQKVFGKRTHLLQTKAVKFMFYLPQAGLAAVFRNEKLKSDTYTLGYVAVLRHSNEAAASHP